jgi:hypothetical protein
VTEVLTNGSRVISQSVRKLTTTYSLGDNDSKLLEKVVGDNDRDLEVMAGSLAMMGKMYIKVEYSCKKKIKSYTAN